MKVASNFSKRALGQKGMTLIEIMIVLIIVGGLAAVLGPIVVGKLGTAKYKEAKIQIGEIGKALEMFNADCNNYPTTEEGLQALSEAPSTCKNWGPNAYLRKVQRDPWGNDFAYESKGTSYVLRSFGADKQEGGEGAGKDISSEELE